MKKIVLFPSNIAVLEGDSHLGKWVAESGRLDCDPLISVLANMIPLGTVAIDAGASIGDHTFGYLRSKAFMVAAFEPNPAAYECLVHNCPTAICVRAALGRAPDTKIIHISNPNYGASFVMDIGASSSDESYHCPVVPLDMFHFSAPVGFIKADVEGFELELLRGAYETIVRDRPIMCLEVNKGALERAGTSPEELLSELHDTFGYTTRPLTTWDALQYDVLAIPR